GRESVIKITRRYTKERRRTQCTYVRVRVRDQSESKVSFSPLNAHTSQEGTPHSPPIMRRPAATRAASRRIFPVRTFAAPRSVRKSGARRFGGASASDCAIGVNWYVGGASRLARAGEKGEEAGWSVCSRWRRLRRGLRRSARGRGRVCGGRSGYSWMGRHRRGDECRGVRERHETEVDELCAGAPPRGARVAGRKLRRWRRRKTGVTEGSPGEEGTPGAEAE
ncbi:hypothetical protein FB451DRAFT_1482871, partial [Mycena latifolia]